MLMLMLMLMLGAGCWCFMPGTVRRWDSVDIQKPEIVEFGRHPTHHRTAHQAPASSTEHQHPHWA